jgi:hypothetical protein
MVHLISSSPGSNFQIYTQNDAVLVWTNLDASQVGSLVIWTAADSYHTVSTASQAGYGVVDETSRYAVYITNFNEGAATCDIAGSLTDGTQQVSLVPAVNAPPNLYFAIAGSHAVVNAATSAGAQINSFVLGTWVSAPLTAVDATAFSGVQGFDATGNLVLFVDPSYNLNVIGIGGGSPTLIAAGAQATQGSIGILNGAGTKVLYAGAGGTSLDSSPVVTPAATILASGTDLSLYTLSPSEQTLLAYDGASSNIVFGSAVANGTLTTLAPALDFGGAVYTSDSTHVLFVSNYDSATQIGQLSNFSVSTLTFSVVDAAIENVVTFGTTKAVFADNVAATTADIKYFDAASVAAPSVIVSQAQPSFAVTGSGQLVYSWNVTLGATAGIYVTTLP